MPAQARPPCRAPPTRAHHSGTHPVRHPPSPAPTQSGTTRSGTTRASEPGAARQPSPHASPAPTSASQYARPAPHVSPPVRQPARAPARRVRPPARHRLPSAPAWRHHDRDRLAALRWGSNGHDHGRTPTEQQRAELAMGLAETSALSRRFALTGWRPGWLARPVSVASARCGPTRSGHCGQAATLTHYYGNPSADIAGQFPRS
jgi:hypothetical protein